MPGNSSEASRLKPRAPSLRSVFGVSGQQDTMAKASTEGRVSAIAEEIFRRYRGLSEDGSQRPLRHLAGMVRHRGVATSGGVEPDFVTAGSLPIECEPMPSKAFDNVAVSETGQPAHQQPSTNGMSNESPTGLRCAVPARSACASSNFRATSRAISKVSVRVRPWATRPGMSSDVAR